MMGEMEIGRGGEIAVADIICVSCSKHQRHSFFNDHLGMIVA